MLVFEHCCGLYGEKSLFSVDCLFCNNCYVWSYWFSSIVVNPMRGGYVGCVAGLVQGKELTQATMECYVLFIILEPLHRETTVKSNSRHYTL